MTVGTEARAELSPVLLTYQVKVIFTLRNKSMNHGSWWIKVLLQLQPEIAGGISLLFRLRENHGDKEFGEGSQRDET